MLRKLGVCHAPEAGPHGPAFFLSSHLAMQSNFRIRTITTDDICSIHAIQSRCYPTSLQESVQTLRSKCDVSPLSCWLVENNSCIQAYLITHPWLKETLPAFNQSLQALPTQADVLFLHDLAIDPSARNQGIARTLLRHAFLWAISQNLRKATLIAVQGTQRFWQHHGFMKNEHCSPALRNKLISYGADAECLAYDLKAWQTSPDAS